MEKVFSIDLLVLLVTVVFFDILIIIQKFLAICNKKVQLYFVFRKIISFSFSYSYAIIRECLVEENQRPEMTRVRALLCHSKMLSKEAFNVRYSFHND